MSYAYLVYGTFVDLKIQETIDYDWTDYIAERYRILKPKGMYTENIKAYDKYSKDKNNLLRKLNIRLEPYGNRKNYSYIVGIHDSLLVVEEGDPEVIEEKYLKVEKEWSIFLDKFLFDLQLKNELEYKWYLGIYNET